jgi:ComF family protein
MKLYYLLMDLLFPAKCILCGKLLKKQEQDLCRDCRTDSPEYPFGKDKIQFLDSFTAVWYYKGYVRKSLLRYKFGGKQGYASAYGRVLAMKLYREYPEGFDCLTWVPISWWRKITRGYDQVQLLAEAVGRELGIPVVPMLKKIRHNRRQSGIRDEATRKANVLGAYQVMEPERVRGRRILLLDDILTTGATASECGRMLQSAGAKEVHCAAIAAARK